MIFELCEIVSIKESVKQRGNTVILCYLDLVGKNFAVFTNMWSIHEENWIFCVTFRTFTVLKNRIDW